MNKPGKFILLNKWFDSKNSILTGRMAEAWLRAGAYKSKISSFSCTAKFRYPDLLTETELIEIKNVKYLRFTNQLKDFLLYSQSKKINFIIFVRKETILSNKLQSLKTNGELMIKYLGPVFTKEGQLLLKNALLPKIFECLAKNNDGCRLY